MAQIQLEMSERDRRFLLMALGLAQERLGFTAPNPSVGAVVVRDNEILSTGKHWVAGCPHAEVEALRPMDSLDYCTLYVSLEPCAHFGRTPPCTELIIRKQVKRVVYGSQDPNPRVAGKGAEVLKAAGIEVVYLPLPEVAAFYRKYLWWTQTGKAWLTGKIALTSDGKVADKHSRPLKITGTEADQATHVRRKGADVLVTSERTVLNDNPLLNVRIGTEVSAKPVWVIDAQLKLSKGARLVQSAKSITLLHRSDLDPLKREAFNQYPFQLLALDSEAGRLNLKDLPKLMGEMGFHEGWVEVGPTLFRCFLEQQLFQEVIIYRSQQVRAPESTISLDTRDQNLLARYRKFNEALMGSDLAETWFARDLTVS
ncbi:MAG: bifunctional diaminohydroxyphosphoribosylaminopyrimidine deaminase/5-amino-6-(5-phosphoribosylamino)uracil reductase RibD [Proteobacteria bacterium]|nr:bifunctional diaminohydroxyphosphoribosylaminopyrimidine deaminase/5-amino-6-(5-phosphoribosylamino)uracil reductase RibD [Pseudomonadota bacterium]NDC22990.1 bifunctional diaminohydroxyphosphoribosylaminopyrimidine deaminase/5-amino-6-(5-phosphoribosylamino)uracil reductase RibD [Pseudomonadota bacterium]NDD03342.1 bifunctional diaminohydroxyphosphoribosylaminopyrimidine deaminase/5-amino-6-(5-phosphoribosylamino)uracil reductase RibD [Pseudomonadota bacterium]NDG25563.1 bifunctional diamino